VIASATHNIRIKLLIQGDANRKTTSITSSADFRNLKSAPTTSVSCRVQNRHIICAASASSDPDGQSISYQWKRTGDSTWETGQQTYLWDSGVLSTGAYTVTVRVSDTDGLYTDATQDVTVP
jgi:hypothetical protein